MPSSLIRRVRRFEAAVREHEMLGAQPVEDREFIQKQYENTKKDLLNYGKEPTTSK